MGLLGRAKKRKPTPDQIRRLAKITDPRQREALVRCIENGESIPESAWHPLPKLPTGMAEKIVDELRKAVEPAAREGGMTPDEFLVKESEAEARFDSLVAKARVLAGSSTGLLDTPIANISRELEYADESSVVPLLGWGTFFLTGVSLDYLALASKPGGSESLIVFTHKSHKSQGADIVGLIPEKARTNTAELARVLTELAKRNRDGRYMVMGELPSHLLVIPGSPLTNTEIKEVIFEFTKTVPLVEPIAATVERFQSFPLLPQKRAEKQMEDLIRNVKNHVGEKGEKHFEPMTYDQFEKWWKCVADPEHVRKELAEVSAFLRRL